MAAIHMAAPIVWLTGCPCSGKTFLADYLVTSENFVHVDGDGISYSKAEEDVQTWKNMLEAFGHWFRGEPAPPELWQAHYRKICADASLAAATGGGSVVIAFAVYSKVVRDFVRAEFGQLAGGDVESLFKFVQVSVEESELVRRNHSRGEEALAEHGLTWTAFWNDIDMDANVVRAREKYGPYSYENFQKWQREDIYPCFELLTEDEKSTDGFIVENTILSEYTGIDQLRAVLGLPMRSSGQEIDTEAIASVNFERMKALKLAGASEGRETS